MTIPGPEVYGTWKYVDHTRDEGKGSNVAIESIHKNMTHLNLFCESKLISISVVYLFIRFINPSTKTEALSLLVFESFLSMKKSI